MFDTMPPIGHHTATVDFSAFADATVVSNWYYFEAPPQIPMDKPFWVFCELTLFADTVEIGRTYTWVYCPFRTDTAGLAVDVSGKNAYIPKDVYAMGQIFFNTDIIGVDQSVVRYEPSNIMAAAWMP